MSKQIDRQLIEKYLDNNCTPEERVMVEDFLRGPESEDLLKEILTARSHKDWTLFQQDNTRHIKSLQWRRTIQNKIGSPSQHDRRIEKPLFLRYAAVWIAMMLGIGGYGLWQLKKNQPAPAIAYFEKSNPYGQRCIITLPDSSVVYLGAGSRLKYPESFTANTREISLEGEAFFEVIKNPKRPFIIHTGDIQTKVLGTSFKIEAFKGHPLAVEVATGKVRVDRQLHNRQLRSLAILTPGQKVVYENGIAKTGRIAVEDVRMWKDAHLAFNNKSLKEIVDELERWYNLKITFRDAAKAKERMTVTLNASVSADKILNVLAAAGHFSYEIKDSTIVIKQQERKHQ